MAEPEFVGPLSGSRSGPGTGTAESIAEMTGVVKHYRTRGRGEVHALDGVTLTVGRGEVLGLVGESGCGKSTAARLLTGLERADAGTVRVDGQDLAALDRAGHRRLRRTVQLVFQDPYASLDPRQRIGDALAEVLTVHRLVAARTAARARVGELLEMVGLLPATAERYPHQLSGGQRQRVGIARALSLQPRLLVLDEPVSALDVSVRAEIVNLLDRLRRELGLAYVFISHDLGMVRHLADRIAVMYLGQIVETGSWEQVSDRPVHPYTQALHRAVPVADPAVEYRRAGDAVRGEIPDAARPPAGCRFHPRCPLAEDVCRTEVPVLAPPSGHRFACHVRQRELGVVTPTSAERPADARGRLSGQPATASRSTGARP
ncbi:ABC transporter ATP-binding protein [Nakamurella endophytica]|uniref:ABC transporter ATP-binding protein n=1 Tax=Nakamurella endophytica TaxID=1748367 RepID=A0A917WA16_9ACTN|nr:ABC transporter ATP-binding protein [Nakamurella endophytica]GGL86697.1 ABC transporter ATP-binding protein [Nakamurella endophytica]